ncbi:MAG TPA: hypothetical protein VLH40_09060, partial [Atribacteraceae bacterium]|nr:hypothetical protein [Atribacteraceae bacterium]
MKQQGEKRPQLAGEYGVHSNQIGQWKKKLLEELPAIFSDKRVYRDKDREELAAELYRQTGQLKVELEWLEKKVPEITAKEKRALIDTGLIKMPIGRQCELLGLSLSGYYYEPQGETELNLATEHPDQVWCADITYIRMA